MSRWFRFYAEALNDPKVDRLPPSVYKTWVKLLCLACQHPKGRLPSIDDIAYQLRMSVHDAQQHFDELILAGLIDISATEKCFTPHNWEKRQYASDSSAERMRRHRAKSSDVTCASLVTNSDAVEAESEPDTESETEQTSVAEPELKAGLEIGLGGKARRVSTRLKEKAEGFGLNVDALMTRATGATVKEPNAYFRRLAIDDLCTKLPRLSEQIIRTAFTKDGDEASKHVFAHLMGATDV